MFHSKFNIAPLAWARGKQEKKRGGEKKAIRKRYYLFYALR